MNLSPADAQKTLDTLKAEKGRRQLKYFIQTFWHVTNPTDPFVDGYHIDAIVDHLENIREIKNLLINIPPRFGKSTLICVLWFCWFWISNPSTRFIFSSYSLQLSIRDSIKCRRVIEDNLYQAYYGDKFKLTTDQNTKTKFENNKGGMRLATSVEGSTTGEGGDIIVADDPHNIQEANSKASRDAVVRWFTTVFVNRVNDPQTACRIIVGQRCDSQDVFGHLLKNDIEGNWTKLILPLEAGKSKYVSTRWTDTRPDGAHLCPERIPEKEANFLKQQLGKRAYDAQYNQNPVPPEDAIFNTDNFRYYDLLPEGGFRIATVDLAISLKGDYTVIAVGDVMQDGSIYLVHLHRERMQGPKIVPTIKATYSAYKPTIVYIEDVAFQRLVIQDARNQKVPVKGVRPEGDKVSRSVMLQVLIEQNKFYLPKDRTWLKDVEEELGEFPNAPHDDIVDALSYLAIEGNKLKSLAPGKANTETPGDKKKRTAEEHNAWLKEAMKKDEDRFKKAFFEGLR